MSRHIGFRRAAARLSEAGPHLEDVDRVTANRRELKTIGREREAIRRRVKLERLLAPRELVGVQRARVQLATAFHDHAGVLAPRHDGGRLRSGRHRDPTVLAPFAVEHRDRLIAAQREQVARGRGDLLHRDVTGLSVRPLATIGCDPHQLQIARRIERRDHEVFTVQNRELFGGARVHHDRFLRPVERRPQARVALRILSRSGDPICGDRDDVDRRTVCTPDHFRDLRRRITGFGRFRRACGESPEDEDETAHEI